MCHFHYMYLCIYIYGLMNVLCWTFECIDIGSSWFCCGDSVLHSASKRTPLLAIINHCIFDG
ncbi:hypothetical protein IC582_006845 [Cucumis melo]